MCHISNADNPYAMFVLKRNIIWCRTYTVWLKSVLYGGRGKRLREWINMGLRVSVCASTKS